MHIGNLRTALFEYLLAKSKGGVFILRIEDTDQSRFVEGAVETLTRTIEACGLIPDEGPGYGGENGPYIQSERRGMYDGYAESLVEAGKAYYCFCGAKAHDDQIGAKYDRRCLNLNESEIAERLASGVPRVVRQLIPEGKTTFADTVFGSITVDNDELDDQILIKSDGLPTYNFANVIDDHLMRITHVVRGSEYLSSTPKYNLLYEALGWEIPVYIHLPLVLNENGEKLSKRRGDASFEELVSMGFLPEAVLNFIALLGWSPSDDREFFTLAELIESFDVKGLSKSPSVFDMTKLRWMNGEYIKRMPAEAFFELAKPELERTIKSPGIDLRAISDMCHTRVNTVFEIEELTAFIDGLPEYGVDLFTHKKSKSNKEIALTALTASAPNLQGLAKWDNDSIFAALTELAESLGLKKSQMLWPIRTALSGAITSPCGASELCALLGKGETLRRIEIGIGKCGA